jgi:hypothetical protein
MTMTVTFEVPPDLEQKILTANGDPASLAKEAYVLELYRQGVLDVYELSRMLGTDKIGATELLQRHRIYRGSLTMEDLEEQSRIGDAAMTRVKRE